MLLLFLVTTDIVFANHCYHFYQSLLLFSRHIINITAIRHHYFARKTQRINKQCRKCIKHIFISFSEYFRQFRKIAFLFYFRNVMNHALTLYRQYEAQCRLPTIRCEKVDFCVPYIYNGKRQQLKKQVHGCLECDKASFFLQFQNLNCRR